MSEGPDQILFAARYFSWDLDIPVILRISEDPDSKAALSIVSYLRKTVDAYPKRIAMTVKRDGKWIKWTYKQYLDDVMAAAKGFIKLGLQSRGVVGILGFNSPEWLIAYMAAIFAGGVAAGIYSTNNPDACLHVLTDSKTQIIVVENDVQLSKITQIKGKVKTLKAIIQYIGESKEPVIGWKKLLDIGKGEAMDNINNRISKIGVNECCSLIYTSGTTGKPKGVMLNHDNYTYLAKLFPPIVGLKTSRKERCVSYLPLSHIAAQIADIFMSIAVAGTVYFAQPDAMKGTLVHTMKEAKPTCFLGVPRVFDKMYERVMETKQASSPFKQKILNWATNTSRKYNIARVEGKARKPILFPIANKLILRKIRNHCGFKRCRFYLCGAAPLSRQTLEFFLSLNIRVCDCFGMSECSGPHIMNTLTAYRIGSCGKEIPTLETKLVAQHDAHEKEGELCMKGRHVFMGYLNLDSKTKETIDSDGWLHSGDIAKFDEDDFLFITGRIKEILITAGGENVAPVPIEDLVKQELPAISQAMLIGDQQKFISILLTLKTEVDLDTLTPKDKLSPLSALWVKSLGCTATTVTEVREGPDSVLVMDAIQRGINRVNDKVPSNAQKIQKFRILPIDFSMGGGELGPTLKVKRSEVTSKYSDTIAEMYRN